jgi:hypothetical protein
VTAATKKCEACGGEFTKPYKKSAAEWAKRRFCSRVCSMKTVRKNGQTRGTHCKSGRHELVGDNVRSDNGRRACKACATEKERERKARVRGRSVAKRAPRRRPAPKPVIPVVSEPKVWRPAGWSSQPRTGRVAP